MSTKDITDWTRADFLDDNRRIDAEAAKASAPTLVVKTFESGDHDPDYVAQQATLFLQHLGLNRGNIVASHVTEILVDECGLYTLSLILEVPAHVAAEMATEK